MKILRTPDQRFADLPDFAFEPHYLEIEAEEDRLRIHYLDEGPRDGEPVLMLHGEPSWAFLYRFMVPPCAERFRVLVPDLIGFGRSDKPARISDYSYASHLAWLTAWFEELDLTGVTLVAQDWGSLLGLRMVAAMPERFARVVIGNGFLPTGTPKAPPAFVIWKLFARWSPWFPISRIVNAGSFRKLSAAERRAYDAPFPSAAFKAGARAFPRLVPTRPEDPEAAANREAWKVLSTWQKPFLTTFSNGDPIMRGGDRYFHKSVPGTRGLEHQTLVGGHFLQEDSGPQFAAAICDLIATTPV